MSTRKDQKETLRERRLERERAEAAAGRRKRLVVVGVAAVAVLAALAAGVFALTRGDSEAARGGQPEGTVPAQQTTNFEQAVSAAGCRARSFRSEGSDHVEGRVSYRSRPPHSGDHNLVPSDDGVYADPLPLENWVHSLEHGRIAILYRPGASEEVRGGLNALVQEDPSHMLLSPDASGMPYEVAAVAWTEVLGCERMNARVYDAIRTFRDRHRDRAPEYVP